MVSGILLFDGRRQQIVLGIIIGLGQYLIFSRMPRCTVQARFHKRCYLIHIQIYAWDVLRLNINDPVQAL